MKCWCLPSENLLGGEEDGGEVMVIRKVEQPLCFKIKVLSVVFQLPLVLKNLPAIGVGAKILK